ncbi:penicillin-binding protein activator [Candidatus Parcubacteria bacterium]|nr:penicillin-binding protein activator [Candidatus Parcubacteria bacterium]
MKRTNKIIILALALIVFLGGCAKVAEEKKEVLSEVIKIGAPLSLTGKLASFGEDLRDGINMAISEVSKQEKIKIEIIYEDTQSEATQAVNSVKKLIEIDNVNIILGPVRSSNILAVAPLTEDKKIIMLTSIGSSMEITNAGDYVFRNRITSGVTEKRMAEFLENKGINKIAVFTAQSANSLSYKEVFTEEFKKLGKEIVFSVEYNQDLKDFRTDIIKAKNKEAEAFYLATASGVDAGILTKQIRELGLNGLIAGTPAFESEEFLNGAGEAAEGVFITSPAFNIENPDIQDYRNKYKELYNKESSAYAANAYDAVKIIANAIENCNGDKDTDCIRDYLYSVKNYQGIGGNTTFDKNGDVVKPVMIKVVKNGEFVPYEEN